MRHVKATLATILLMASSGWAQEIPTAEQLKQLEAEKKWSELLAGTTRAIALKGDKAAGYDRAEVLTLKAEAQLQLKQFSVAAQSFEAAGREKTSTPEAADLNLAMAVIAKKSDAQGYKTPASKGVPAKVINIFDPANRKEAFTALFDASIGDVKSALAKSRASPALPALTKVAKEARELQSLERAATGKDDASKAIVDEVDGVAVKSISNGLKTGRENVQRVRARAEERVQEIERLPTNRPPRVARMRGLDGNDRQVLNGVISQCKTLAGSYKQFVESIPEPSSALKDLPGDIQRLHDEATDVLERNYQ